METNGHGIVVGYDGSPGSETALAWAARTAHQRGEPVLALIVMEPTDEPRTQHLPEPWWHEIEDRARETLDAAGCTDAHVERRIGPTVGTLVDAGRDAAMLVVGTRGHGHVGEVFLGSVSQSAARHARCPLVVVRPPSSPGADRIVVGVDGSETSLRALDFACRHALVTGEKIAAVRAWKPLTVPVDKHGDLPPSTSTRLLAERTALDEDVEAARHRHPGVAIDADFIATSPRHALVDASAQATLLVVGSRGRNAVEQTVLGSVSHEALHRAHCPVVVVR
jgi:nucleotide-binding universal stress UspA family protein